MSFWYVRHLHFFRIEDFIIRSLCCYLDILPSFKIATWIQIFTHTLKDIRLHWLREHSINRTLPIGHLHVVIELLSFLISAAFAIVIVNIVLFAFLGVDLLIRYLILLVLLVDQGILLIVFLFWRLVQIADILAINLDLIGDSQLTVLVVLVYRHNLLLLILPYLKLLFKWWHGGLRLRLVDGVDNHGVFFKTK